ALQHRLGDGAGLPEETDSPRADVRALVPERFSGDRLVESAYGIEGPQSAQDEQLVGALEKLVLELRHNLRIAAFMQQAQGGAIPPGIVFREQLDEAVAGQLGEIARIERPGALALDLVDAAALVVPRVRRRLMARVLIVPVDHVDGAVGAPAEI